MLKIEKGNGGSSGGGIVATIVRVEVVVVIARDVDPEGSCRLAATEIGEVPKQSLNLSSRVRSKVEANRIGAIVSSAVGASAWVCCDASSVCQLRCYGILPVHGFGDRKLTLSCRMLRGPC